MTNEEAAELKGQIVGLKVLLMNCLSFMAGQTSDPLAHLSAIRDHSIAGLAEVTNSTVRPQHLQLFRAAAAGIVSQVADNAKAVFPQGSSQRNLQ
jgi:hypothetical protein